MIIKKPIWIENFRALVSHNHHTHQLQVKNGKIFFLKSTNTSNEVKGITEKDLDQSYIELIESAFHNGEEFYSNKSVFGAFNFTESVITPKDQLLIGVDKNKTYLSKELSYDKDTKKLRLNLYSTDCIIVSIHKKLALKVCDIGFEQRKNLISSIEQDIRSLYDFQIRIHWFYDESNFISDFKIEPLFQAKEKSKILALCKHDLYLTIKNKLKEFVTSYGFDADSFDDEWVEVTFLS